MERLTNEISQGHDELRFEDRDDGFGLQANRFLFPFSRHLFGEKNNRFLGREEIPDFKTRTGLYIT